MPGILFSDVSKTFNSGASFAVHELNLSIDKGEFIVFLGSSGSGKTTTLKMINRLLEPSSGTIFMDDANIRNLDVIELRRSIGYVFQGIGLLPHMTVAENVELVPKLLGWKKERRRERAHDLLGVVGLPPAAYAQRFPEQLSGGQQQRVGVARALAAGPSFLLMDEPFGALDAITRDSLQQEMLRLHKEMDTTIIFVTHDLFEALTLGERIAIFDSGKLEQVGTPHDILREPASDFVRNLFEKPAKQLRDFRGII